MVMVRMGRGDFASDRHQTLMGMNFKKAPSREEKMVAAREDGPPSIGIRDGCNRLMMSEN